jgi:hypothetical protein
MHVELLAKDLLYRPDQSGMGAEQAEGFVIGVGGKGGSRCAGLLAPDFAAVRSVNLLRLLA